MLRYTSSTQKSLSKHSFHFVNAILMQIFLCNLSERQHQYTVTNPGLYHGIIEPLKMSQLISDAFLENRRPNHSYDFFLIIVYYIAQKQGIASREFQFFFPQQGCNKWKNYKASKNICKAKQTFPFIIWVMTYAL